MLLDGRVGRPWAHLLPRAPKLTAIYRATIDEKDLKTSRKDLLKLKLYRRKHNKTGSRGRDAVRSRPKPLGGWSTNGRIIRIAEILPEKWGVRAPHWAPPLGRCAPRISGFEDQQGLVRGLLETETSLLKGVHKMPPALRHRAEAVIWKKPGLDPLEQPPGDTGGNWNSPWGHRCWWQPIWGAHATTRALVIESAILESFLPGPGPGPTHQPVSTRTGTPQAKLLTGGHSLTHQQTSSLRIPRAPS